MKRKGKTVLITVAHTDDEALGMGGTIAKHIADGDTVTAIAMTDGISSRPSTKLGQINERIIAAEKCSKILGFSWLFFSDFPDNAMDSIPLIDVVKTLERAKEMVNPDLVYTHSCSDLNIDHRIVTQAALTAFRPEPQSQCKEIRAFEVPSATDFSHKSIAGTFQPNLWIDITRTWIKKINAIQEYASEIKSFPHSRSLEGVESLVKYRGCQVGVERAEAFEILRRIED